MPPDNATREVGPASAAGTAVTHTDHEYVMYTHAASGVAHINASDPPDRGLVIFELVEYDIFVVPDHRRGLAELNFLRQGMVLAVCELYVTMHHGCINANGTHRRCVWNA